MRAGRAAAALVAAAAVCCAVAGCGGGGGAAAAASSLPARSSPSAGSSPSARPLADLRIVPRVGGKLAFALPAAAVVSFDVALAPMGAMDVELGQRMFQVDGAVPMEKGWLSRGEAWHFELAGGRLTADGRVVATGWPTSGTLRFQNVRWSANVTGLIISPAADRAALLFHRLAELHARVPSGMFPSGASVGDRLHYDRGWTSGFYAGALWQAAALEPAGDMFERWALAATLAHLGLERSPTHDVGFMYGQSSLNAWRALCAGSVGGGSAGGGPAGGAAAGGAAAALCGRLRASVLSAADELRSLAATNPGAGTIPTGPTGAVGDTIVDSMMNIAILPWATRFTGRPAYARLALHQARVIASVLVRRDGSTAQAANFDRTTGRLLFIATHQGLSATSTWSRGEGWALYGFSQAAVDLRDRALLAVALRVARYVATHLPAGGVPRWDYDAPRGAPVDVSAGVITATGFMRLAAACRQFGGTGCSASDVAGFVSLSRRMLIAALGYASPAPPLGLLRSQIQNERAPQCWCNHGELIYGLSYALEALRLLGVAGS